MHEQLGTNDVGSSDDRWYVLTKAGLQSSRSDRADRSYWPGTKLSAMQVDHKQHASSCQTHAAQPACASKIP